MRPYREPFVGLEEVVNVLLGQIIELLKGVIPEANVLPILAQEAESVVRDVDCEKRHDDCREVHVAAFGEF